ncbi:hypothetical protein [Wolbachia endosymbiont of Dactylopius coccus]
MTAVLRHTAAVSLNIDPANKQRDDGCQGQRPYDVIQVADTGIQFLI